jgi:hypothetical protein
MMLGDEPETARLIFRDLVNATLGFEHITPAINNPQRFRI